MKIHYRKCINNFYKIKKSIIKNQESRIDKLIKEKNEMSIQIMNFESDKMVAEIERESAELLEKNFKTFENLRAANEKF